MMNALRDLLPARRAAWLLLGGALVAGCILAPDLESSGYTSCTSDADCAAAGRVCGTGYCSPPPRWDARYAIRRQLAFTNPLDVALPKGFPVRIPVGPEPRPFRVEEFNPTARVVALDRSGNPPTQVELDVAVDVQSRESFDALVPLPAELPPGGTLKDVWFYAQPTSADPRTEKSAAVLTLVDDFEVDELDAVTWRTAGAATLQDGSVRIQRGGALWSTTSLPASPGVQLTLNLQVVNANMCAGLTIGLIANATQGYDTPYVAIESGPSNNFLVQALASDTAFPEPATPASFALGASSISTRVDLVVSGRSVRVLVRGVTAESFELEDAMEADLYPHIFIEGGTCEVLVEKVSMRPVSVPDVGLDVGPRISRP